MVSAQVPPDTLRRSFPNQTKIGPVESIRDLITVALPGITVSALPVVPRQLPYYAGRSYFELDRTGPYWAALKNSAGIAIHVTGGDGYFAQVWRDGTKLNQLAVSGDDTTLKYNEDPGAADHRYRVELIDGAVDGRAGDGKRAASWCRCHTPPQHMACK